MSSHEFTSQLKDPNINRFIAALCASHLGYKHSCPHPIPGVNIILNFVL